MDGFAHDWQGDFCDSPLLPSGDEDEPPWLADGPPSVDELMPPFFESSSGHVAEVEVRVTPVKGQRPPPPELTSSHLTPPTQCKALRVWKKSPGPYSRPAQAQQPEDPHREKQQKAANYARHPCLKAYKSLQQARKIALGKKWRQWRFRVVTQVRSGKPVVLAGTTFQCEAPEHFTAVRRSFDDSAWVHLADDVTKTDADRGYAMNQFLAALGSDAWCSAGDPEMVYKGKSVFMTYNGPWGIIERESLAREVADIVELDILCEVLAGSVSVQRLSAEAEALCLKLRTARDVDQYAWSCELSTRTWRDKREIRVHIHLWLTVPKQIITARDLILNDTYPIASAQQLSLVGVNGTSRSGASMYAGCFYTTVQKIGSITRQSSKQPFVDFLIKDAWITSLFASGKITSAVAEACYVQCVVRAEMNVRQLRFVEGIKKDMRQRDARRGAELAIRSGQQQFREIALVKNWEQQYTTSQDRYRFLVLDGPSRQGKT